MDNEGLESAIKKLVAVMAQLRNPKGGCPWDLEQDFSSIAPHTIEEAYEVDDAIRRRDFEALRDELGDLLFQVAYHAQMAREEGLFGFGEVVSAICDKMVRRHPHVFGDHDAKNADEVLRNWEALKEAERAAKGEPGDASMLDSVPRRLPAVMEAFQMTTKVARVGFDWPNLGAVLDKLDEEVRELKAEVQEDAGDHRAVADEMGDLLFAAVNVARLLGVDPESALKAANRKFRRRFRYVEDQLRAQGRKPADSDLKEMDALWNGAKAQERKG